MNYYKANFSIADSNKIYNGYSCGEKWNGWECPYFTKDTSEKIVSEPDIYKWGYNEKEDYFIVILEKYDEPYVFAGIEIAFNDETIKVYGVGAYGWCWDEV